MTARSGPEENHTVEHQGITSWGDYGAFTLSESERKNDLFKKSLSRVTMYEQYN